MSSFCIGGRRLFYPESTALVVWDMDSRQPIGRLEGHNVGGMYVAARGNLAVSADIGGGLNPRLWNLETMQCAASLAETPNISSTCCAEGKVLLGSGVDGYIGRIKVWDVGSVQPVLLRDLEGHTSYVHSIKADRANMVLSGSRDQTVRLWDLRTGKCVRTMEGHTESVGPVDMDGHCRAAVSCSYDKSVKLWDLGSGQCTETYELASVVGDVMMHESGSSFLSMDSTSSENSIMNAWAMGCAKPSMRVDMAALFNPSNVGSRLLASRDLATVAYCTFTSNVRLCIRVWG